MDSDDNVGSYCKEFFLMNFSVIDVLVFFAGVGLPVSFFSLYRLYLKTANDLRKNIQEFDNLVKLTKDIQKTNCRLAFENAVLQAQLSDQAGQHDRDDELLH